MHRYMEVNKIYKSISDQQSLFEIFLQQMSVALSGAGGVMEQMRVGVDSIELERLLVQEVIGCLFEEVFEVGDSVYTAIIAIILHRDVLCLFNFYINKLLSQGLSEHIDSLFDFLSRVTIGRVKDDQLLIIDQTSEQPMRSLLVFGVDR